jgi:tetratricopeptide (TPR) repeat protein
VLALLFVFAVTIAITGCSGTAPLSKKLRPDIGKMNMSLMELTEYIELALKGRDFSVETLLMLTEEYFVESTNLMKDEFDKYEEEHALFREGHITEEPSPPAADHTALIASFRRLMNRYPTKANMDALAYTIGYATYEAGRTNEAMAIYEDFLNEYEYSIYYTEIAFRLGEIYFDEGYYEQALRAYKRILDRQGSVFYTKALYKTAWTHYKFDDFSTAIDNFIKLIEEIGTLDVKGDRQSMALRQEAIDTIVIALTHMQIPMEIKEKITSIRHNAFAPEILLLLGERLTMQTRLTEAISVYDLFQEVFSDDHYLPRVASLTALTYERLGMRERSLEIQEKLVTDFNPTTVWYSSTLLTRDKARLAGTDALQEQVDAVVSDTLLSLATYYRETARANKDDAMLKQAVDSYQRYIDFFPEFATGNEVHLLLGESSFDAKEYSKAATRYESTMRLYKSEREGEKAAFAALLSLELTLSSGEAIDSEKTAKTAKRIMDFFLKEFTETIRKDEFLQKISNIFVVVKEYKLAREALRPLLRSSNSWEIYKKTGGIFLMEKKFLSALNAYEEALDRNDDRALRDKVGKLHYVVADEYAKSAKNKDAIAHYFEAFNIIRDSKIAEDSLVNIANIYAATEELAGFRRVLNMIKANYPGSRSAFKLLVEAGKSLEIKGSTLEAAALFEEAGLLTTSITERQKLVFKSADMLEESLNYNQVARLLNKAIADNAITNSRRVEALYRIGNAYFLSGKREEGLRALDKIAWETTNTNDHDSFYIAKAKFTLAKDKFDEFAEIKIIAPLEETLLQKKKLMDELLSDYSYVVKSKQAESMTESFYMMGRIFEEFREALLESERPVGLTSEELAEYNFQIEEQAYPFEDEAVAAYESGLKSSLAHMGDEFIQKTIKRLEELRPALYKRELAKGIKPIFISPVPVTLAP